MLAVCMIMIKIEFGVNVMCCMLMSTFHVSSRIVTPTSVSHPFSLNSSLGLAGGNITRKLQSLSLDLFFKILLFQVAFLIFFSITIISPLLSSSCPHFFVFLFYQFLLELIVTLWGKIMISKYRFSLTHSLMHARTHSLTHSPTHPPTQMG